MTGHLAIVLPGGNGDPWTAPVLLPTLALEQVGASIERIAYTGPRPGGLSLEDSRQFNAAVAEQVGEVIGRHRPARVSFVAKSRGALFLAAMDTPLGSVDVDVIWVTPLLGVDYVRAGLLDKGWSSLIIAGGADPYHDAIAHAEVCRVTGAQSLVIEGANHGLVVDGDVVATAEGFRALAESSLTFVQRHR